MVKFVSHLFKGIAGRSNNEYRISNVEGIYSARREPLGRTIYFIKKIEQSDSTLRHSAVRYSIFCSSLFKILSSDL